MITQQQAAAWIKQHGIEKARNLCLAIENYCVGECDISELREFLSDVYRDGHKGTSNFTEQDCIRMISGDTGNFFDDDDAHTMDDLIQVVGDYYDEPCTAETVRDVRGEMLDQLNDQQNAISNLADDDDAE